MGLTKRKDSYYVEFRVVDDGETLRLASAGTGRLKRWKVGCTNKTEATKQEAIIRTRLLSGQIDSPSKAKAKATTFGEWADRYLQLEEVRGLRSYQTRKYHVGHLKKFFGERPLASLTPEDIRKYREWRAAQKVVTQTVNHDHAALTHLLNVAMSDQFGLVTTNVAAAVRKPNPNNERDRIATRDEWSLLKEHGAPHLVRFLTVAYDLGPRRGELLKLEWSDVDMKRKEFRLKETKNGESRTVPMTPEVHKVFKTCWQERRLDTNRVFLFRGKPIAMRLTTAFKAACKRAGIPYGRKDGGLTIHDFRHTAATNLRRAGVDTMTAMKVIGHKSEKMHRRYNQIAPEDLQQAVSKLSAYHARLAANTTESAAEGLTP